jgi:hypothetical protein
LWHVSRSFSKMYVCARCFVQCYKANYAIKVLILGSWQRRVLRLCIHSTYTQCVYNRALYTYVNVCTYTASWCSQCVHGLTTGLAVIPHRYCGRLFRQVTSYRRGAGSWIKHSMNQ